MSSNRKKANIETRDEPNMDTSNPNAGGDSTPVRTKNRLAQRDHRERSPPGKYKPVPPKGSYDDWAYKMRREMQEIIPGLYLGPYSAASKSQLENLKKAGITHIVCVRHMVERKVIRPVHEDSFNYLVIEMADNSTELLIPHCHKVNRFLDKCFESGGKALVHGNSGISRSSALVIAYVMATYGCPMPTAFSYVQSKRFAANPNEWFKFQLREYEAIYMAQHDLPHELPQEGDQTRPSTKRNFDAYDQEEQDEDQDIL